VVVALTWSPFSTADAMALAFKKYSSEKLQTEVIFNLSRVIYYCLENTASKRSVVLANVTVTVTAIVNSIFH